MTSGHKEMIVERFPEAKDKTFTLKQFVSGTDGDIADPFGGPIEVYRAARDELEKLIDRLAEKLQTEQ